VLLRGVVVYRVKELLQLLLLDLLELCFKITEVFLIHAKASKRFIKFPLCEYAVDPVSTPSDST
jgi:hypothetical protein